MSFDESLLENYLRVFRMVFERLHQIDHYNMMMGLADKEKNGLSRFLVYLIHLYSYGESAAIEVKVRIGQLWCPRRDSNARHPL